MYNEHDTNAHKMLFPKCDFRALGRSIEQHHPQPKPAAPVIQDDRTEAERATHCAAVMATDPGMSQWGGAPGGRSVCVWACAPGVDVAKVLAWVGNRSDMTEETEIDLNDWEPSPDTSHVHIYTVNPGHPGTI